MPDGITANFRGRQYYNAQTTTLYNYGIFAPPNAPVPVLQDTLNWIKANILEDWHIKLNNLVNA